jgi:hypothetical protein
MPLTEKGKEIKAAMTEEYGEKKSEQVLYASKNAGTIKGIDSDPMINNPEAAYEEGMAKDYKSVGNVSLADINRMGRELWAGPDGNIGSVEGSESSLPTDDSSNGPIKVYQGMADAQAEDEVSPTQSDPPDKRSDNLLTREHGGIPGTEA